MATAFEEATTLRPRREGLFEGTIDERFWVIRAPHGGYLAAVMLRGLTAGLDDPGRAIRSFTTHFVAAAKPGAVEIRTRVERVGRKMSVVSARAEQGGDTVAISLGAFSEPWDGLNFDGTAMPETKSPEDGFRIPRNEGTVRFLDHVEMSATLGQPMFSGAKEATVGGWIQMTEPQPTDATVIAMYMDAFAPAVWPVATEVVVSPTIDFTVHFRTAFPLADVPDNEWYLGRFTSSLAREGFFEEDGALWSPDGRLVAQSRQLALALLPAKR